VNNLGPLEHAELELGELLTLFVGPNNIGKTIISRSIYALGKSIINKKLDKEIFVCCLLDNFYSDMDDLLSIVLTGKQYFFLVRTMK